MAKIMVIGSINMDLVVEASRRPKAGETLLGQAMHTTPGGKGANQAIAAAKLGAQVTMVGAVGQDVYANQLINNLNQHQINTESVQQVKTSETGVAVITLAEGDNSIVIIEGANREVTPGQVADLHQQISQQDLVILQHEIPEKTVLATIELCANLQVPVLLNPAPARPVPIAVLEQVTYVTPNEHEVNLLVEGWDEAQLFHHLQEKLMVTKGQAGVAYFAKGQICHLPAYSVEAVDTTGAGDTFNGAFAYAIVSGYSLDEAIQFAQAAAALSVKQVGAQAGMPTLAQVQAFLQEASRKG